MTPTKESLDRAKAWLIKVGLCNGALHTEALALLLDRMRLEGKKEALTHVAQILNGPLVRDGHIGDGRLLEHVEARLTALTQPAGEKEG